MRRKDGRRRVPEGMDVIPVLFLILAFILVIQSITLDESQVSGNPSEVYTYLNNVMYSQPVEYSLAAGFSDGNISYVEIVGTGGYNSTSTDLVEVIKRAHEENVTQIALLHNHPNHATYASGGDLIAWRQYNNYIAEFNVTVKDAVILGRFPVIYRPAGDSDLSRDAGHWERVQGVGIESKNCINECVDH